MNVALILLAATAADPPPVTEPLESPATWVTAADYPAAAFRAGVEGTTTVRIEVAPSGVVANCAVAESSGSELLDLTACGLMKMKGRYKPFEETAEMQVRHLRYTWKLPDVQPNALYPGGTAPALQPFALEYSLDVERGVVSGCRIVRAEGVPVNTASICSAAVGQRPPLSSKDGASARLTFRVEVVLEKR